MKLARYQLTSSENLMTYEFVSDGPKGRIPKLVQYSPTNLKDVYNLAFGDRDLHTGQINDEIISNNGDSEKVLATVVATIYAFTDKHPDAWIYATGSTKSRTRLYRMGVSKNLADAKADFEIYGELKDDWVSFKNGIEYDGFLVKRKKS
ncbi:MAG: hypothetical protein WBP41_13635 [Saprospiraceae bacterium]